MSCARASRRQRGFSIVEAIVAAALLAVGVAASVAALGSLTKADTRLSEVERMTRLAETKLDELVGTGQDATATDGTFDDIQETRYRWNLDVQPTTIENLDALQLNISRIDNTPDSPEVVVSTLRYRPQASTGITP